MVTREVVAGIVLGFTLAVFQSTLSVLALRWTRRKTWFMWVWGAGIAFRFLFFLATAYAVHEYSDLSLIATLMTLVVASTVFLVAESTAFLQG